MAQLILVRHGETEWNKQKRYQGIADVPLSKKGISQAKRLAKKLKAKKIGLAYTSCLKRAVQTAEEILRYHRTKLTRTKILNERSYGSWSSLTKEEVKKQYPQNYKRYKKDKFRTRPKKGESLYDLRKKVLLFIRKIKNSDKTILIVSHNGPLRIISGVLNGLDEGEIAQSYTRQASFTVIKCKKSI